MNDLSDRKLVQGVVDGDATAHSLFVARFHRLVWALVTRLLASFSPEFREDAYQEVFLRLLHGLSSWEGGNLAVWVGRVTVNRVLGLRKQAARFKELPLDDVHEPPDHGHTPVEDAVRRERTERIGRCVQQCLAELPVPKRTLIELALQDVSRAEIQGILGISRATFYYWLREIRDRLSSHLGDA